MQDEYTHYSISSKHDSLTANPFLYSTTPPSLSTHVYQTVGEIVTGPTLPYIIFLNKDIGAEAWLQHPSLQSRRSPPYEISNKDVLAGVFAPEYFIMVCTTPSLTVESYGDLNTAKASGAEGQKPLYNRRRHSSFNPRRNSTESGLDGDDRLLLRVRSKIHCALA